ncbi:MAG: hypothetical protein RJB26_1418, partial [Pseudomonadota bacterium]
DAAARPALPQVRAALETLLSEAPLLGDGPAARDVATPPPVVLPPDAVAGSNASEIAPAPAWRVGGEWETNLTAAPPWWKSPTKLAVALVGAAAVVGVLWWHPAPVSVNAARSASANDAGGVSAKAEGASGARSEAPTRQVGEAAPKVPTDPAALARMAAAKSAADEQRDAYRRQREALAKLPVAAWAEAAWAEAQAVDAAAQARYDKLDFAGAGTQWVDGLRRLRAVGAARAPALAAALAAGQAALAKPDSRGAATAFRQALAIQPGHAGATVGLKRAQTLDEVVHLLDAARLDQPSGRIDAAQAGYRRALALDPATTAARTALARLQQQAGEAHYRGLLASAWQQLGAGRREQARTLFNRAGQLRPGAPEVAEGLAQVDAGNRSAQLAGLKTRAANAERAERWAEAEALYAEALGAEPGVSFATEGRERAGARARLDAQLQGVLDDPSQALRPALRQMARVWLEQAGQQPAPKTRLQQQALGVARLVAAAERPVRLVIQSDGETQLTVLRTRRLGGVSEATVEVLPGRVVVVGTRPGYRDVRREVDVQPDSTPAPLVVRCEERI